MTGGVHGGRDGASDVVAELAAAWGLELVEPASAGRGSFEARSRDGAAVLLQLRSTPASVQAEALALRAWDGRGAPALLELDEERGALLLERVQPGTRAPDATAAEVARLLGALAAAAPDGLPSLFEVVAQRLDVAAREGRASGPRLAWAQSALERLREGGPGERLVHGAFGAGNLLQCERRGLCAIDPSPSAGDPAYDAACWIHAGGKPGRRARFEALARELEHEAEVRSRAESGVETEAGRASARERLRDWCGIVAVQG